MVVKSGQRGLLRAALQRGLDSAADLSDLVAHKITAAADPRARLLRRRRRALRWAWIFTAGCLFWALVTAGLAAWGWFALLLQVTGAIAVIQVIPATLLFFRYFGLKAEPLPAQSSQEVPRHRPTCSRRPRTERRRARSPGSACDHHAVDRTTAGGGSVSRRRQRASSDA